MFEMEIKQLPDWCLAYYSAMQQCDSPHQGLVTVFASFGRIVGNSCNTMSIYVLMEQHVSSH
jgi:hypothetical protein